MFFCFQRRGSTILDVLESIIPYISGLYTLPWIVVGFFCNIALGHLFGKERIMAIMKKISLVLLFVFIPILLFKLFLNIDFREEELDFVVFACGVTALLYGIAYLFGSRMSPRVTATKDDQISFLKTIVVNQGRSAAFFGSAILALDALKIYAAIYITLVGLFLFAIVPYTLSVLHNREVNHAQSEKSPLPLFLRIFPWYLLFFPVSAAIIHHQFDITTGSSEWGVILDFLAAVTIPAALYYVGSSIRIADMRLGELRQLFISNTRQLELKQVRATLLLTMVITPALVAAIFGTLLLLQAIPAEWFAVIFLNAVLPVSSTNMFLVPYGINYKATALAVTWTTLVSLPVFVLLLAVMAQYFA